MQRALVIAVLGLAGGACRAKPLAPDGGSGVGGSGGEHGQVVLEFPRVVSRDVDVLFMIANPAGTIASEKLTAVFSTYVSTLESLPGGLPNLHLAVVSSSMGAGRATDVGLCPPGGDHGVFQATARSSCAATGLADGQNFISNVNGQTNYTGELSHVFDCIAALGDTGCAFEHQLASIARALGADGQAPPAQNANFLRADAYLQVVVLSDQDDCSAPPDSDLFDTSSQLLSDPLGPLQTFRCNEFGHLCGGKPPPRTMAADLSGTCVSNEHGRLVPVGDFVKGLKALKSDPAKVLVAAISAPPNPYIVGLEQPQGQSAQTLWPYVKISCLASDGTFGLPAVRIKQWVDGFGDNGIFQSICNDSFAPALQAIGQQIGRALSTPCLASSLDPSQCKVVDHFTDAQGETTDVSLYRCAGSADTGPCWDVESSTVQCPTGQSVRFIRPATSALPTTTTATCAQ